MQTHTRNAIAPSVEAVTLPEGLAPKRGNLDFLWPVACLLLLELITFGVNVRNVGFYWDEWISFGQLYFQPHSLIDIVYTFLLDPRKIIRPLDLYIPVLFCLVGLKPLWYHIVGYALEFLGGWFLFLALARLSGDRFVALTAAALFLVYPTHDSTHYVLAAHGGPIAASLFTLSLWLFLKGIDENRNGLIICSTLAYCCSLLIYEQCLPLVVLYPLLSILRAGPGQPRAMKRGKLLVCQLPFVLVALSEIACRLWLIPRLGISYWNYGAVFKWQHFLAVIAAGININFSPSTVSFCSTMIADWLKQGQSLTWWLFLSVAVASVFICLFKEGLCSTSTRAGNLTALFVGVVTLLLSYTIFGVSPGHNPTIDTWLNRVNICGSLGASLIIGGLVGSLRAVLGDERKRLKQIVPAIAVSIVAGLFIMVDWQFAKGWIVSWRAQRELMAWLQRHASEVESGDSIILGGMTRYASKSACVVDGIWDFQNIARTTLDNANVNATVVTERLTSEDDALVDRFETLVLGRFPFKRMILWDTDKSQWVRISSRQEFDRRARELGWKIPIQKAELAGAGSSGSD